MAVEEFVDKLCCMVNCYGRCKGCDKAWCFPCNNKRLEQFWDGRVIVDFCTSPDPYCQAKDKHWIVVSDL